MCVLSGSNETWYAGGVPWTRVSFTSTAGPVPVELFRRGDTNDDGQLDIADAISILLYLFSQEASPTCLDAADANDDEQLDIADAIALLTYLFADAEALPAPFPDCGPDQAGQELGPCVYRHCSGP